jgi:NAD(P)-dependent dehydrogenase (short-subunit alcohol dehydrogenase family)
MEPVTIITGGASGIGLATARRLRETGGRVALLDIDVTRCRREAEQLGDGVAAFECDVIDEASLLAAASRVEDELGPIEALVCGAGAPQVPGPVDAMAIGEWEAVVDSHLKGTFLSCRIFGGRMIDRGRGVIVNIASVTGYAPGPTYAYAPSKAAIITLTTILAVEWARKGVRVNAVAPGWTDTPFLTRKSTPGKTRDMTALANASPLGRLMDAGEIAEVIYFLLSPQSSAIIGCTVPCDGGFLASRGWAPYGGVPQS